MPRTQPPTYEELETALNLLRLARKDSTQQFARTSYTQTIQSLFDYYDAKEFLEGSK